MVFKIKSSTFMLLKSRKLSPTVQLMEESPGNIEQKKLPFNNLYLISGLVHGFNKSWMYVFTILLMIFGYLVFQSLEVYPLANRLMSHGYTLSDIQENANLLFDAKALQLDKNLVLLLELGMFVFGFLGFYVGLRYFHQKQLLHVLSGYDKFRYGRFWFAFAVWAVLLTILVVLEHFINPEEVTVQYNSKDGIPYFNFAGFFISLLIMLLFMPLQTGLEELVFRGYLIQGLSQVFRNGYVPLIITSLLFGLAHMTNPEVKAYGWPIMLTYFCCFALFMGAITLLDEGLELAFGIHFANNIISSVLISSPNSVIKTYSIFQTRSEDPYTEIWVWLGMASISFFIFKMKYRWKNFRLILK